MNIKERLEKSYTLKEPDFGLDNGVHFKLHLVLVEFTLAQMGII